MIDQQATHRCAEDFAASCTVLELRRYTLQPGSRDTFLELFDRQFVDSQERLGSWLFGQFRDLDDPDRVVWLRGFRDMPARAEALTAFYGGPVWRTHRDAANVCIVDSDDVLLLRPADGGGIVPEPRATASDVADGIVVVAVCYFDAPVDADFLAFFQQRILPVLRDTGAIVRAGLVTEASPNNFRLPVREGEHVFVWWAGFADLAAYERHATALAESSDWRDAMAGELRRRLIAPPEILRLTPTPRSRLRA
jgi:quinol monooxygenase YgiN